MRSKPWKRSLSGRGLCWRISISAEPWGYSWSMCTPDWSVLLIDLYSLFSAPSSSTNLHCLLCDQCFQKANIIGIQLYAKILNSGHFKTYHIIQQTYFSKRSFQFVARQRFLWSLNFCYGLWVLSSLFMQASIIVTYKHRVSGPLF